MNNDIRHLYVTKACVCGVRAALGGALKQVDAVSNAIEHVQRPAVSSTSAASSPSSTSPRPSVSPMSPADVDLSWRRDVPTRAPYRVRQHQMKRGISLGVSSQPQPPQHQPPPQQYPRFPPARFSQVPRSPLQLLQRPQQLHPRQQRQHQQEATIRQRIEAFLRANPRPSDAQVHALAAGLGISERRLEEYIYALLADLLNNH